MAHNPWFANLPYHEVADVAKDKIVQSGVLGLLGGADTPLKQEPKSDDVIKDLVQYVRPPGDRIGLVSKKDTGWVPLSPSEVRTPKDVQKEVRKSIRQKNRKQ